MAEVPLQAAYPMPGLTRYLFPLQGFMHGDLDMEDYYLRIICADVQISIVNVDYRLVSLQGYQLCYADQWAQIGSGEPVPGRAQ